GRRRRVSVRQRVDPPESAAPRSLHSTSPAAAPPLPASPRPPSDAYRSSRGEVERFSATCPSSAKERGRGDGTHAPRSFQPPTGRLGQGTRGTPGWQRSPPSGIGRTCWYTTPAPRPGR